MDERASEPYDEASEGADGLRGCYEGVKDSRDSQPGRASEAAGKALEPD